MASPTDSNKTAKAKALSPAQVQHARPGAHHDGRGPGGVPGLYLICKPSRRDPDTPAKSWKLRYWFDAKERWLGLGAFPAVSLAQARDKARAAKSRLAEGQDPQAERDAAAQDKGEQITFKACAKKYISVHRDGWKNAAHAGQWKATLETYAYPVIGELPVGEVTTDHVLQILEPIWSSKNETASRVRGRIQAVLGYAGARGWRDKEQVNPALWDDHLSHLLPARTKVQTVVHHAALPWREMAGFMAELRTREAPAARALELTILTAARTSEVLEAQWSEFDLEDKVWTVPASRMKMGREHRVPLSDAAMDVLRALKPGTGRLFKLSNMGMIMLLRRMGRDATVHGCRSSFRSWCAETGQPGELAEMALAHTLGKVEAAYQRSDMLERRRVLMDAWARLCAEPYQSNVVVLQRAAS